MNNNFISWLGVIFIISLIHTGCSHFKDDVEIEKYKDYVSAKAIIDQKFPERVTRYGAKQARYNITMISAGGEKITRFNCELGGSHKEKDTITVYYDPKNVAACEIKELIGDSR